MVLRGIIGSIAVLLFLTAPSTVRTWNLDVRKERSFTSLPKSYFGYSLSTYQPNETATE